MNKLPECSRCQLNAKSSYIICAVHPEGVNGNSCIDFREDPNAETDVLWEPVSANYIDGELVIERSYYNGEEISQPQQRLTREEQWEILNTHPLFTGHCPDCGYQFPAHIPELVHFDCPQCGWIDDSV
jgi:hypothetical protein